MSSTKPWLVPFLVSALLAIMGVTCVLSLRVKSPTVDEFAHLPAGYYYWKTGDFTLYDKNPPLIRLFCALPLLAENVAVDWSLPHEQGGGWRPWIFGTHFMKKNKEVYDHLFFLGRLPIVLLTLLLGFFVFRWAKDLYGPWGGIVSLVFYTVSPNILAHGRLVTTDLGFTCFMFITLYYAWRSFFIRARRAWIPTGIFLGFALLSKFTGLLLLPILVTLAIFVPEKRGQGSEIDDTAKKTFQPVDRTRFTFLNHGKGVAGPLVLSLVVAVFIVNMGYGFKGSFQSLSDISPRSRFLQSFDRPFLNDIPLPVPAPYVRGFDSQKIDAEQGEFLNYMDGKLSDTGWWYYFIYAFCLKVPMAVLAGLALSLWVAMRSRKESLGRAFLVVPIFAILTVFSFLNQLHIGIRYILPAFPLLFVWLGNLSRLHWRSHLGKILVAILLMGHVAASYSIFPDYIAFFNSIAGGPDNGPHHLLDSNLDWGQDLKQLKGYMDNQGIKEVDLAYFGHVDPHIYGINHHPLEESSKAGHMAISANFLFGLPYVLTYTEPPRMIRPGSFSWLQGKTPKARIGHSIYVFSD